MAEYHLRPHVMPMGNAAAKLDHRNYLNLREFPIAELVPRIDNFDTD